MNRSYPWLLCLAVAGLVAAAAAVADEPIKVTTNTPDEPLARKLSLEKTAEFLDATSLNWTEQRRCGTCHTNYPYLMARPTLKDSEAHKRVRSFFEKRVANWDSERKEDKPRWDTEVVATAAALAVNDALTTGKLHPLTRQALDRMWTLQKPNGAWDWLKCNWPPFEHDDYYGALFAAVGVGHASDGYAQTEKAREGLKKLREYFKKNPPPNLHHKAWLMWASLKLDGLMSTKLRESTIAELRALQRADGGWSLASLGDWVGVEERPNDRNAPSDGYGTGFTVFVLRQAGVPVSDQAIERGVAWLKSNQRESGRWFTRSLSTDNHHFITHAGTAYAVLALKACGVSE
jgi:squalene-hopene/tetraprenyl-beta-curcumene cyclase